MPRLLDDPSIFNEYVPVNWWAVALELVLLPDSLVAVNVTVAQGCGDGPNQQGSQRRVTHRSRGTSLPTDCICSRF
jgi:hypothetical protein